MPEVSRRQVISPQNIFVANGTVNQCGYVFSRKWRNRERESRVKKDRKGGEKKRARKSKRGKVEVVVAEERTN